MEPRSGLSAFDLQPAGTQEGHTVLFVGVDLTTVGRDLFLHLVEERVVLENSRELQDRMSVLDACAVPIPTVLDNDVVRHDSLRFDPVGPGLEPTMRIP